MKSKAAQDAINSIIEDKLRHGLNTSKKIYKYGNTCKTILDNLSEIINSPLTLKEQTYLNGRKKRFGN